jgi:hypothetical protein
VYAGLTGILDFGITSKIFQDVVGNTVAFVFNIGYIVAGLSVYFGIGTCQRNIEAFGLIALITSALIRTVSIGYVAGFNPVIFNSYVFSLVFIIACIVRLHHILNKATVLAIQDELYTSVHPNTIIATENTLPIITEEEEGC